MTLTSLFPATYYSVRTAVVYPDDELLYSNPDNFTTVSTCTSSVFYSCNICLLISFLNGVPEVPEISFVGTVLHWSKLLENGEPIEEFVLKHVSRY